MSDYWKQFEGKSVPLKGLLQWLSDEHEHVTDDEGESLEGWDFPVVNSMALHRWAIAEAGEVEYEYAVQDTDPHGHQVPLNEYDWRSLKNAEVILGIRVRRREKTGVEYTSKIVKRVKAGPVEDA